MSVRKRPNGRWEARERTGGRGSRRLARTFDRKADADKWVETMRRQRQLGAPLEQPDVTLDEFVVTYWELHVIPNLAKGTRDSYRNVYERHISPRIGDRDLRALTPKVLTRFRADLERANVGVATVRKALAVVQSILSFAIVEEHLELNAAAAVAKPFYERAREPYVFLPPEVEQIRQRLDAKSAALVALLAYAGPRPEEALRLPWQGIGREAIEFDGRKTRRSARGGRRYTPLLAPLAGDLKRWKLESGARDPRAPVIPAHDGAAWQSDDWRNWRRRVWGSYQRDRKTGQRRWVGVAPEGTRPRDLRSSFITLQIYAGVPLTTIARWCGTSVEMLDRHYAGVIANWDGVRVSPEQQIQEARETLRRTGGRSVDVGEGASLAE
jgi:integrase